MPVARCIRSPARAFEAPRRCVSVRRLRRRRAPRIARGGHTILPPDHHPERHGVLGQVRVRPLVDVVGDVVAPVLEELGRRPGVVDLVEVHLVRLLEPIGPEQHRADEDDQHEPQVEAVEAAAAFESQERAAVGADRDVAEPRREPADDAQVVETGAWCPCRHPGGYGGQGGSGSGGGSGRSGQRRRAGRDRGGQHGAWRLGRPPAGRDRSGRQRRLGHPGHARLIVVQPVVLLARRERELILERLARARAQTARTPTRTPPRAGGKITTPAGDLIVGPIPSQSSTDGFSG